MPTLEEITYDAARDALREQEAEMAGIRQRTGTLLAAHALVASFLGSPVLREQGLIPLTWLALASLVGGLVVSGAYVYLDLHHRNARVIRHLSRASVALSMLMVAQTVAWVLTLA